MLTLIEARPGAGKTTTAQRLAEVARPLAQKLAPAGSEQRAT